MTWVELAIGAALGGGAVWVAQAALRRWQRSKERGAAPAAPSKTADPAPNGVRSDPTVPESPGPARPRPSEGARHAGRVVLHLAAQGRLGRDEVASVGFTQRGMCEALDVRQGPLAKTLARLEAAGVVQVDRGHVRGAAQRLKVYRLTPLGESVARDLRHRGGDPAQTSEIARS